MEFLFWFWAWYSRAYFCTPGFFLSFSFASASSFSAFNWHSAGLYTGGSPHLGAGRDVCPPSVAMHPYSFTKKLWDLMVMIDMSERTARRCSGITWLTLVSRFTQESVWITRVATEIVFQPLQSGHGRSVESAVFAWENCISRRDCIPAFAIRHGRSLCEESAVQFFFFSVARGHTESGFP